MNLELRSDGIPLDRELEDHVQRRLRFALTRFADRLRRVHVLLQDVNGPRGGDDIRCQVRLELAPRGELVVRETGDNPFSVVARTAERASRRVSRHLERLRERWKGRRAV